MAHHTQKTEDRRQKAEGRTQPIPKAFTLFEVLMAVMIVGMLAGLGIPTYRKTVERGYWREAQDLLLTIYYGERAYFTSNGAYFGPLDQTSTMAAWRTINMDNPNLGSSPPVTFSVTAAGATLTATATRTQQTPPQSMTIDQNRTINTASWPMP